MPQAARPRRSALYMPATNARAVEKARALETDVVILDLEDAVLPDQKVAARAAASAVIRAGGYGRREVIIRVNALETAWGADDLTAVAGAGPDGVLAPKVRDAADVRALAQALTSAPDHTRLWVMIETVQSIFNLNAIADATPRLAGLVMGINDLAREMGARQTAERAPFFAALSLAVTAARAHDLVVLDGVHNEIEDLAALERVCQQGVDFGFDGKTLIHPSHLPICNQIFSPSPSDVAWARAVIAAYALPENSKKGALQVEGRLAERLHLDQAERLVEIDAAIHGLVSA